MSLEAQTEIPVPYKKGVLLHSVIPVLGWIPYVYSLTQRLFTNV